MFWTNYEFLCKSIGKSPNAVAALVGVKSSGSVTAWKKNDALPRQSTLKDIADFFGVSVEDLVYTDLVKEKKPIPPYGNELDDVYSIQLTDLRADEIAKVHAFVAGLKASRMP